MKRGLRQVLLASAVVLLCCTNGFTQVIDSSFDSCLQNERCIKQYGQEMLIQQTRAAKRLIEEKGEEVFSEFQKPGSVWNNGLGPDLFLVDTQGRFVVHPSPQYLGEDALKIADLNGKPYIRIKLEDYEAGKKSWVRRQWNWIKDFHLERQHYVEIAVAPDGRVYLVGSSLKMSATQRLFVETLVSQAARLVQELGTEAFPVFCEKDSEFQFKDTYIFVLSGDGTFLVNPAEPRLVGKNPGTMDPGDAALLKGPINLMRRLEAVEDAGWEVYEWYKPGGTVPMRKASYGQKVRAGGRTYIVGTGVYLENWAPVEPEE